MGAYWSLYQTTAAAFPAPSESRDSRFADAVLIDYLSRRSADVLYFTPLYMYRETVNLHSSLPPEQLFAEHEELGRLNAGFFFGKLVRAPVRGGSIGEWVLRLTDDVRSTDPEGNDVLVGSKYTLVYFEGGRRTKWVANLFIRLGDYDVVMCKLYIDVIGPPTPEESDVGKIVVPVTFGNGFGDGMLVSDVVGERTGWIIFGIGGYWYLILPRGAFGVFLVVFWWLWPVFWGWW